MEQFDHIKSLFQRYAAGIATPQETNELFTIIEEYPNDDLLPVLESIAGETLPGTQYIEEYFEAIKSSVLEKIHKQPAQVIPIRRKVYKWWAAAAAVLIIAFAATYIITSPDKPKPIAVNQPVKDVQPGMNGAVLTLADGSKVQLDSLGNGVVTTQNKTTVTIKDGQLVYSTPANDQQPTINDVAFNTMSTPNGRQYQLVLPDGTQVWLNAASSITYPVAFVGAERNVTITGEAYFEVAKDKTKPFHVGVNNMDVEVLGTHFNVNSYVDEAAINTTLLEGSVKVTAASGNVIIKPGQQATLTANGQLSTNSAVDIEQVMAWKNGRFQFDGSSIEQVMRQLSRWYDIEVVYEGHPKQQHFNGSISRNSELSKVFKILETSEAVHFRIEGKKVIVTP